MCACLLAASLYQDTTGKVQNRHTAFSFSFITYSFVSSPLSLCLMPTLLFPPLSFLSTELIYFSLYDSLSQPFPLRSLSYFTPLVLTPSVSSLMFCIFQNDTVYLRCCLCHSTPSASPLSMLIPSILPFIHLSALMTVTLETWISCQDRSLSAA